MLCTKNSARPTEKALQLFRQPIPAAAVPVAVPIAATSLTSIARPPSTLEFASTACSRLPPPSKNSPPQPEKVYE